VWEWDEHTQEYYLHLFCPEQPDLNWENPETRQAIYKSAMEFWLQRGVDGFRVDTVNMYSKGEMLDAPITDPGSEWQFAGYQYCNGPRMAEFLNEMNQILEKYDAMTVGECPHTPDMKIVLEYVSAKEKQLNMVFQFVSKPEDRKNKKSAVLTNSIGRRRRRPRPLQVPNYTEELDTPTVQTCHGPHARPHSRPLRWLDYRLPREPRPKSINHTLYFRCARAPRRRR
jgi:glycosidase